MDNAAAFLAASILYSLAGIVILIAIVVANNIIDKFWKSLGWQLMPAWFHAEPSRFASQEELNRIAPTLDDKKK